jgi:hypothetical protein
MISNTEEFNNVPIDTFNSLNIEPSDLEETKPLGTLLSDDYTKVIDNFSSMIIDQLNQADLKEILETQKKA